MEDIKRKVDKSTTGEGAEEPPPPVETKPAQQPPPGPPPQPVPGLRQPTEVKYR